MMTATEGFGQPRVIRVRDRDELPEALRSNGISIGRRVLVCIGGASEMSEQVAVTVGAAFEDLIAPALDRWSAAVVDGGTDVGVMQMVGRARVRSGRGFPLVGVAAVGTVRLPDLPPPSDDAVPLEPNHTHVVLVPGQTWGDETPWLSEVAAEIAQQQTSVTLMVNGGVTAMNDARASIAAGRPLVVLAGSGRGADEIAQARAGQDAGTHAVNVAASPLTSIVDACDPRAIVEAISGVLLSNSPGN